MLIKQELGNKGFKIIIIIKISSLKTKELFYRLEIK